MRGPDNDRFAATYSVRLDAGADAASALHRIGEALAAFEKKLMGVAASAADSAVREAVDILVEVRGGADREHLEKLLRDHLAGYGLVVERRPPA